MNNSGWASELGRRRENQDAATCRADLGLFAVADGIGGEPGGAIASQVAIDALERFYVGIPEAGADALTVKGRFDLAIRLAHRAVIEAAVGDYERMGTTLVAARVFGDRALVGHIGDSRVYRMRDGVLDQLTADHSMLTYWQSAVGSTELMPSSMADTLTRALARGVDSRPDFAIVEVQPGDVLMLCSDGVSKVLRSARIALTLGDPDAGRAARSLVEDAIGNGGRDNATAVVVRIP